VCIHVVIRKCIDDVYLLGLSLPYPSPTSLLNSWCNGYDPPDPPALTSCYSPCALIYVMFRLV
jgi:hypothetical protein